MKAKEIPVECFVSLFILLNMSSLQGFLESNNLLSDAHKLTAIYSDSPLKVSTE